MSWTSHPTAIHMARAQETLRNALVVAGGYYLSTWLVAPFWVVVGPWTNRGGHRVTDVVEVSE
jgi:hypothetical protein